MVNVTAAVVEELHGPFRVEELELDEPGPGEALVRVVSRKAYDGGGRR